MTDLLLLACAACVLVLLLDSLFSWTRTRTRRKQDAKRLALIRLQRELDIARGSGLKAPPTAPKILSISETQEP